MLVGFRVRAEFDDAQTAYFAECDGVLRAVWNTALDMRREARTRWRASRRVNNPHPTYENQANQLAEAKKDPGLEWLRVPPAVALQQTLRDLDKACHQHGPRRVKFRAKHSWNPTLRYPNPKDTPVERLNRKWGRVFLPKFGWVRFRWTRPIPGLVRNVTVKQAGTRIEIVFLVETGVEAPPTVTTHSLASTIGLDMGVVNAVATTTGGLYNRVFISEGEQVRLLRLQRTIARIRRTNKAWRTSKRYKRVKAQMREITQRQKDRRLDFHNQIAAIIARQYSLICHENLNVKNMTSSARGTIEAPGVNVAQKTGLNKSILEQAWGQFFRILKWHGLKTGSHVVDVPAAYTSQQCPACNHTAKENRESQAVFLCVECGLLEHADIVGALNVRQRGIILAVAAGHAVDGCAEVAFGDLDSTSKLEVLEVWNQRISNPPTLTVVDAAA